MSKELAEQLHRIEHKLDLVLEVLATNFPNTNLWQVGDQQNHICPLCRHEVGYATNLLEGHTIRLCGCKTGKVPSTPYAPGIWVQQGNGNAGKNTPEE